MESPKSQKSPANPKQQWPEVILSFKGEADFSAFEAHRDELEHAELMSLFN